MVQEIIFWKLSTPIYFPDPGLINISQLMKKYDYGIV